MVLHLTMVGVFLGYAVVKKVKTDRVIKKTLKDLDDYCEEFKEKMRKNNHF